MTESVREADEIFMLVGQSWTACLVTTGPCPTLLAAQLFVALVQSCAPVRVRLITSKSRNSRSSTCRRSSSCQNWNRTEKATIMFKASRNRPVSCREPAFFLEARLKLQGPRAFYVTYR